MIENDLDTNLCPAFSTLSVSVQSQEEGTLQTIPLILQLPFFLKMAGWFYWCWVWGWCRLLTMLGGQEDGDDDADWWVVDCGLEACDEGVVAEQGAAACPPQWGTPPQFSLLKLPNNARVLPYSPGVLLLISTLLVPTSAAPASPFLPPTLQWVSRSNGCRQKS